MLLKANYLIFLKKILLAFWLFCLYNAQNTYAQDYQVDLSVQNTFNKIFSAYDFKFDKLAKYRSMFKYSGLTPLNNYPLSKQDSYEKEFDEVWKLVQNDFLYQDRLSNWQKWKQRFHNQLTTTEAEKKAIKEMLSSLKDEYTSIRDDFKVSFEPAKNENCVIFYKLKNNIGYIKITDFSSPNLITQFVNAIEKLKKTSAYIIDLRNNPGGSVDIAFKVFNILARQGEFVEMVGYLNGIKQKEILTVLPDKILSVDGDNLEYLKRLPCLNYNKPIAILINRDTMSAAEMLAGACKYNNIATLIGQRTFGKGVVQRVWNLNNHCVVRITSENYFLPNGASINGKGLYPDYCIENTPKVDNQLNYALSFLSKK